MKLLEIYNQLNEAKFHSDPEVNAVLAHIDMNGYTNILFIMLKIDPKSWSIYKSNHPILYRVIWVNKEQLKNAKSDDIIKIPKVEYASWSSKKTVPENVIFNSDWFDSTKKRGDVAVILKSTTEEQVLDLRKFFELNKTKMGKSYNYLKRTVDEEYEVICKSRPIKKSDIIKIEDPDGYGFNIYKVKK
jgi:hypothetical protein